MSHSPIIDPLTGHWGYGRTIEIVGNKDFKKPLILTKSKAI